MSRPRGGETGSVNGQRQRPPAHLLRACGGMRPFTTIQPTQAIVVRATGAALLLAGLTVACTRKEPVRETSAGTVDTAVLTASAFTPSAGPGAQVTRTDAKSVHDATQYKLTEETFAQFM